MTRPARTSRPARILVLAGAACLVAVSCGDDESTTGPASVTVTDASGVGVTIDDIAAGPLVVNLWATWCQPCVAEMPAFDEVASDPETGDVTIIGVNVGDDAVAATDFATDLGITYPQYTDPDGLLSTALAVSALPATAFFDTDGTLVHVHSGAFTSDELRTAIHDTLGN